MASCVFLLLVVIALSGLGPASSKSWSSFQNKHIDNSVRTGDNAYCNSEIRNRRITDPRGQCKPENTFIHARPSTIKGLCRGIVGPRSITSNNPYDLTYCRHNPRTPHEMPPYCSFRAFNYHKRIRIMCVRGVPVHFVTII